MNMKLLMNTHQYIDYIYMQIVLYVCIGMHITTLEMMRYIWCREREELGTFVCFKQRWQIVANSV